MLPRFFYLILMLSLIHSLSVILFLSIFLALSLTSNVTRRSYSNKPRVLVICSSGSGTHFFLPIYDQCQKEANEATTATTASATTTAATATTAIG